MILFGMDWTEQLRNRITTVKELETELRNAGGELKPEQRKWFGRADLNRDEFLPFQVTPYYLHTALSSPRASRAALLRQIIPEHREFYRAGYELDDPLGEEKFTPVPRLIHRYNDRALLLVTDECAAFCRHCFRRSFSGGMLGMLGTGELEAAVKYLAGRGEIKELLLSGGDPLTLSDARLAGIINAVREARPDMIIRLCSRAPVVLPQRITDAFAGMLSRFDGLWFVTHFNHPAELTMEASSAVKKVSRAGVPVLNQTVLLSGVNDSIGTLAELFQALLRAGVKPYYLFQGDLAAGTSHLRVPLGRAIEIVSELRKTVSGMAMPRFSVDLPGGGGKISLPENSCDLGKVGKEGNYYILKGSYDDEYRYPAD